MIAHKWRRNGAKMVAKLSQLVTKFPILCPCRLRKPYLVPTTPVPTRTLAVHTSLSLNQPANPKSMLLTTWASRRSRPAADLSAR